MGAATESGDGDTNAVTRIINIEHDIEGDRLDTSDYFFSRIGKPVPVSKHMPTFSLDSPPSRALAVSDSHRLLFVAHSSGFCVASTKEVMDAAKEIEEKGTSLCVQELSIVDVPIGNVGILDLSSDSLTLAVSVDRDVHFFSVEALLNKEEKPLFSCSVSEGSSIKDFRWKRSSDNSFIVLSNDGKLYHGIGDGGLVDIMDNVDAVELSVKGKFLALARGNILSILSSKFKERLSVVLPFKSWVNDSEDITVKVDSIRWIRRDCIIVGCFQQTADGREENYLLQVVKSKDGKFTDATSELDVLSFYDIFSCIADDIIPYGSGPYLYVSYLKQCGLAIAANRKNTDQHIVLLSWSIDDDASEIAVLAIDRDNCLPRIAIQDNGDDNLIMGLCIDSVSLYGEFKVEVGVEEQKEFSPSCVLICVTLDGKLVMFNFASIIGNGISTEANSMPHDEEEDASADLPTGGDHSVLFSGQKTNVPNQVYPSLELQDSSRMEADIVKVSETPGRKIFVPPPGKNENSLPAAREDATAKRHGGFANTSNTFLAGSLEKVPAKEPYQGIDYQQPRLLLQGTNFGQSSSKTSLQQGATHLQVDSSKTEGHKLVGFGSAPPPSLKNLSPNTSLSEYNDSQKSLEVVKEPPGKHLSAVSRGSSTPSWPGGKLMALPGSDSGPSFQPSTLDLGNQSNSTTVDITAGNVAPVDHFGKDSQVKDTSFGSIPVHISVTPSQTGNSRPFQPSTWGLGHQSDSTGADIMAANVVPGDHFGKSFQVKDTSFGSSPVDFSVRPSQTGNQRTSFGDGKIKSLPSLRSPFSAPESFTQETSPDRSLLNTEPNFSRQFGDIKEMAKELDTLLEGIEGRGGFRDSCIVFQRSSVEALEEGMSTLFKQCRILKSLLEERRGEIRHLLDKTVQVLARRTYVEDIVKQASDSQYWELWNRQKLSAELELKRQHILKLSQDLTNQLIELERHFNALELHKSGEDGEVRTGPKVLQSRYTTSRQTQSLQSLYNTINSQLAAAERLSKCLSKQMAALSIESPVKQKNVKEELFEMIGLPYDASFSSPDTLSNKKLSLSSSSGAIKSNSQKLVSSSMKSSDPETSRRRRDSLDQSWKPTRTTVKRINLQESQKTSLNKSPLFTRAERSRSHMMNASVVTQKEARMPSSTLLSQSGDRAKPSLASNQYTFPKQPDLNKSTPFKWVNESALPSQATGEISPQFLSNNFGLSHASVSQGLSATAQNQTRETGFVIADKSASRFSFNNKSDPMLVNDTKPVKQSQNGLHDKSMVPTVSPAQMPSLLEKPSEVPNSNTKAISLLEKSIEVSNSSTKVTLCSGSNIDIVKNETNTRNSFSESANQSVNFAVSPVASGPAFPSFPGKVPLLNDESTKAQAGQQIQSSTVVLSPPNAFSLSPTVASSPAIDSSLNKAVSAPGPASISPTLPAMPISISSLVSKTTADAKQTVSSASSPSVSPSQVTSAGSSSTQPSYAKFPSFTSPSVSDDQSIIGRTPTSLSSFTSASTLGSFKTDINVPVEKTLSGASQPAPSTSESATIMLQPPATINTISSTDSDKSSSKTDADVAATAPLSQTVSPATDFKLGSSVSSVSGAESTVTAPGSQPNFNVASQASNVTVNVPPQPTTPALFGLSFSTPDNGTSVKKESLDAVVPEEDDMEEEVPDTSGTNELSLGSLGGFGIGSTPSSSAPKSDPFGDPFGNVRANQTTPPFTMTVPSSELFRPASFNFQSPQPSQPLPPTNLGAFGSATLSQSPTNSGFGQPAQIGPGQQALGSVLGSFGQSRQFGAVSPGAGFAGGFASSSSPVGFSTAATSGGFASMASGGGGFASMASGGGGFSTAATSGGFASLGTGGGGFASMASGGGGFGGIGSAAGGAGGFGGLASAGGGFGSAASTTGFPGGGFAVATSGGFAASGGGGFGAFSSQQGGGGFGGFGGNAAGNQQASTGFSAFGGNAGVGKPSDLFTQMRK